MTQRKHLDEEISKAQAAAIVGVSIRTVERYIEDRALTKIKSRSGRVTVLRSEVESLKSFVTITPAILPNANPPATLGVPASSRAPGRESEHE